MVTGTETSRWMQHQLSRGVSSPPFTGNFLPAAAALMCRQLQQFFFSGAAASMHNPRPLPACLPVICPPPAAYH